MNNLWTTLVKFKMCSNKWMEVLLRIVSDFFFFDSTPRQLLKIWKWSRWCCSGRWRKPIQPWKKRLLWVVFIKKYSKKGLDRICVSVFVVPNMTYRESQSAALVFDLTLCQISWRLSTTLLESGKNVLMALVLDQDLQDNCCFWVS